MTCGNFPSPVLFLLAGLPGAGKTTFAAHLLERVEADHIESDAIRRRLAPEPRYTSSEHARVFAEVERQCRHALAAGRNAIVDATNLQRQYRARFDGIIAETGARTVRIWLTAPFETIEERLSAPRNGHSQAGLRVYHSLRPTVERYSEPAVVVDTRFELAPTLDLVVALARGNA